MKYFVRFLYEVPLELQRSVTPIQLDTEYFASVKAVLMGLRNEYVVAELVFEREDLQVGLW